MKKISNETALKLLKWGDFFLYFLIIVPIVVVLYQSKGISVGDFFMIQGLFRVAAFLFEIPSGYLSDTFSRRKIMLIGAVVFFLSVFGLFWAYGFWQIAACEMGLGLSGALFSGTKEAYAYDLLKRMNREKQFLKEYGSISTYSNMASFLATLTGAALYSVIGNNIILVEAFIAFLAVVCVLFLPELHEVRRKVAPEKSPIQDIMGIVKMSVKHPEIKWFMLFPAIFASFTLVMFWIIQPVMKAAGIATVLFGLFIGINQFSRVVFSKYAHKVYDKVGHKKTLYLSIIMMFVAIISVFIVLNINNMFLIYLLCGIIAIVPASQKLNSLMFNSYIHHRIKSDERGTVLSVNSMYNTFISGGMMMLMKPLMDGFGIEWTMIITLFLFMLIFIPLRKILAMKI
ncbi:MAG TPA: MFS transporter [Alphaproteobacteria bacterium]|nr:MFS transporter [Alphaproteobacteria bacterium]